MSLALFAPLSVAVGVAGLVAATHCRLPPQWASRLLAVTVAVLFGTAAATLWAVSIAWLWHIPSLHAALGWCPTPFSHHHPVPLQFGLVATALALFGTVRAVQVLRINRRLCRHDSCPLRVADHAEPFAVTLPGRGGQVVVSSGLMALLTAPERAVVLAHESAHARCRHDRYQLLARLAERSMPLMRPLSVRLQFSLERWADEHAVHACGDRQLVARTLGKVALTSAAASGALAFGAVGVTARVKALLVPPLSAPGSLTGSALAVALLSMTAMAGYQLHHLAELIRAICLH
jgi:Zn-dependent protease with chaperone function